MELTTELHRVGSITGVNITAYFTAEEQFVLSQTNQWQTVALTCDPEYWKRSFWSTDPPPRIVHEIKFYQLLPPGYRIDGFREGYGDRYKQTIDEHTRPLMKTYMEERVRRYQIAQRDTFFNGTIIDITPGETPPPNQLVLPTMPPAPRGLPPIGKLSLDGVPTKNYSRINLADFVAEKIAPTAPADVPEVEQITWHFEEPEHEDDHRVMLYAVLSAEERALIKRFGLHHHSFGEVPLFDEDALERLQHAQEQELAATIDAAVRASLRIEHKEQIKYAREAKIDITLEFYFAYPFVREYPNRWKATAAQKQLQSIMMKIKQMLDEHRGK